MKDVAIPIVEALPRVPLTPEEQAVHAMFPFVAFAAMCLLAAFCALNIVRCRRRIKCDAIVLKLRAVRATQKSWEERRRDEEEQKRAVRYLNAEIRSACSNFAHAAWCHNGGHDMQFESVDECLALLPDLVHGRVLEADHAKVIEGHRSRLAIAAGKLRTKQDELERAGYLDSLPGIFETDT